MLPLPLLLLLAPLLALPARALSKRGLVYIPSPEHPADDAVFLSQNSTLTWYYNYQSLPSPPITASQAPLEFVPMLWGDHPNTFLTDVRAHLPAVKYVLAFNEPDMDLSAGGSNITPQRAVELWRSTIQPLSADGVKLGAPAVSSAPAGTQWLQTFMKACTGCTVDFVPVHWYGSFEGLASHIGYLGVLFPGVEVWVTELGYAHVGLVETEAFFNASVGYLDRLDAVGRYSWFGAFRADVSNVGPNGAMLDAEGRLTELGGWYLGRAGGVSGAGRSGAGWWGVVVGAVVVGILW